MIGFDDSSLLVFILSREPFLACISEICRLNRCPFWENVCPQILIPDSVFEFSPQAMYTEMLFFQIQSTPGLANLRADDAVLPQAAVSGG